MTMRSYVEPHMRESLANHTLEIHVDTPQLKAWYLRPAKGGRMMATLILSTVEGLVIMGDLCPGQNGAISCLGYGAGWFGGRLSEQYLCSKFMGRVFVPEIGDEALRHRIIEARRGGAVSKDSARDAYNATRDAVANGALSGDRAYDIHTNIAGLQDFESLGYDYEPGEAGWLCAIQQRFAELYTAQLQAAA